MQMEGRSTACPDSCGLIVDRGSFSAGRPGSSSESTSSSRLSPVHHASQLITGRRRRGERDGVDMERHRPVEGPCGVDIRPWDVHGRTSMDTASVPAAAPPPFAANGAACRFRFPVPFVAKTLFARASHCAQAGPGRPWDPNGPGIGCKKDACCGAVNRPGPDDMKV